MGSIIHELKYEYEDLTTEQGLYNGTNNTPVNVHHEETRVKASDWNVNDTDVESREDLGQSMSYICTTSDISLNIPEAVTKESFDSENYVSESLPSSVGTSTTHYITATDPAFKDPVSSVTSQGYIDCNQCTGLGSGGSQTVSSKEAIHTSVQTSLHNNYVSSCTSTRGSKKADYIQTTDIDTPPGGWKETGYLPSFSTQPSSLLSLHVITDLNEAFPLASQFTSEDSICQDYLTAPLSTPSQGESTTLQTNLNTSSSAGHLSQPYPLANEPEQCITPPLCNSGTKETPLDAEKLDTSTTGKMANKGNGHDKDIVEQTLASKSDITHTPKHTMNPQYVNLESYAMVEFMEHPGKEVGGNGKAKSKENDAGKASVQNASQESIKVAVTHSVRDWLEPSPPPETVSYNYSTDDLDTESPGTASFTKMHNDDSDYKRTRVQCRLSSPARIASFQNVLFSLTDKLDSEDLDMLL